MSFCIFQNGNLPAHLLEPGQKKRVKVTCSLCIISLLQDRTNSQYIHFTLTSQKCVCLNFKVLCFGNVLRCSAYLKVLGGIMLNNRIFCARFCATFAETSGFCWNMSIGLRPHKEVGLNQSFHNLPLHWSV